ncbi:MAG: riboflavin synthase, partial [candidate division Zixibacteria bacterium]|nr:riboflavin synthase [candidate division Zixibacteria bacterium]
MFTGLIEATGEIRNLSRRGDYRVLAIASSIDTASISLGESIACDGACLTITKVTGDLFVVEASPETVTRTILGEYKRGTLVNLERA